MLFFNSEGKVFKIVYEFMDVLIYLVMFGFNLFCYMGEVVNGWLGILFLFDYLEVYFDFI